MPKLKDYYGGTSKATEKAKREVVRDIARFGSEANRINDYQIETQDALAEASVPDTDPLAADNAGLLSEMAANAEIRTGNFEEDRLAAKDRNKESRKRLRGAHKRYLDKLEAATPFHKRQMKTYRDDRAAALAASSAGRGGGGSRGGGSAKKAKASSANVMDPAEKMRQDGYTEAQIQSAGGTLANNEELAKKADAAFAAAYEGGGTFEEVMSQMDVFLSDAGMSQHERRNLYAVFGSKWGTAFDERDGNTGDSFYTPDPKRAPQTPKFAPGVEDNRFPKPGVLVGGTEQAPQEPQPLSLEDFAMKKPVGSDKHGGVFYDIGVLYDGKAYTYEEWADAVKVLEWAESGVKDFFGFG